MEQRHLPHSEIGDFAYAVAVDTCPHSIIPPSATIRTVKIVLNQQKFNVILFVILAALLAACNTTSSLGPQNAAAEPIATPTMIETQKDESDLAVNDSSMEVEKEAVEGAPEHKFWGDNVSQIDEQGAVVVEIVPVNPNNPGMTLDFKVFLNTHSIDLSMDLAALATLETNSGATVQATAWDAPVGGHHVNGTLSFPAIVDGAPLLENVSSMTIHLVDVDVPERVFTWTR